MAIKSRGFREGRFPLPSISRRIGVLLAAALVTGSCDGSLRLSGWMLGGKDRRIVDVAPNGTDVHAAARPAPRAQETPSGVGEHREPAAQAPQLAAPEAADPIPLTPDRGPATGPAGPRPNEAIGTGKFTADKPSPVREAPVADSGSITLNFVDADIRDVIKSVLGSTLGHNFAIDPTVKGTVTLQTTRPLPRSAVLPTLESALSLNGVSIVRSGTIYRVVPSNAASRNASGPRLAGIAGTAGQAYGVEIFPLEFAAAGEMAKIIEPLAPTGAVVRVDTFRNLLIIGGSRQARETIADIVAIFDVDWMSGMSFALVPLQYAQPQQAITDLERIFVSETGGPLEGLVRFFPVERRQSVLVVSANPALIDRARGWIKRLDVGGEDEKRLYVYAVENARAIDLAEILGQVFSDAPVSPPSRSVAPGQREAQISSLPTRGRTTTTTRTPTVTAQMVGPPVSAAQASGEPAAPAPRVRAGVAPPPASAPQPPAAAIEGRLPEELTARIIADDVNNALVVMARPAVWRMIEDALRKLDIVPLQVLIEATIAEVTLNDELRYGVQAFFARGSVTATLSRLAAGDVSPAFPGFAVVYDNGDVRAVLDALDSITDVRVISSPKVLVLDNRTAELQVGDQVPVPTQQSVTVFDPDAPVINRIEFRDTGVILRVTPRVNASGVVNLEIVQEESSAVETTTSGIDAPTIQQRKLRSTVIVNSGETIALGGLIRNTQSNNVSGVPFLASIPVLGALFSSTTESGRRTELLAFITPRVIRNQEDARAVTRDLRESLRDAAALGARGTQKTLP